MTERSDTRRQSAERAGQNGRNTSKPDGTDPPGGSSAGTSGQQLSDSVTREHEPSTNQVRHEPIRASRHEDRDHQADARSEEPGRPDGDEGDEGDDDRADQRQAEGS
jgi:hypothetical protein